MPKMVWDNDNQRYTITATNVGPKYNITISSAKDHVFLGNININTSFKEYKLIASKSFSHSLQFTHTTNVTYHTFSWNYTDLSDNITTSGYNTGILLANDKSYTVSVSYPSFTFYYEINSITLLTDNTTHSANTEPGYVYYYLCLDEMAQSYGVSCSAYSSSTGTKSFKIYCGGAVYCRYAYYGNTYRPMWYYRATCDSNSETVIGPVSNYTVSLMPSGNHLLEIKARVY